jgi:hypothetical protein
LFVWYVCAMWCVCVVCDMGGVWFVCVSVCVLSE